MNEWNNLFAYPPSSMGFAASRGDADRLKDLLQQGSRPDTIDHRGWTALHIAAAHDKLECVSLLLEDSRTNPLQRTHNGETAAELAVISKASLPVVKLLLENGGRTVMKPFMLHVACYNGALDIVKFLVTNGSDVNVHEELNNQTPLHRAAEGKRKDVLEYLLSIGAHMNEGDSSACTPLFEAVNQDSLECVQVLLQAGADPNRRTCDGVSPLMMACQKGNTEIVKLLLSKGAMPNLLASDFSMAITLAVHGGWVDIVRILLPLLCHNVLVRAAKRKQAGAVSLFCVAIDSDSEECLSLLLDANLPLKVKTWPLHRYVKVLETNVKYLKCGAVSFLLMDKMAEYSDRTIHILDRLIKADFPVSATRKGELPPLVAALSFPLLQPPAGQPAVLEKLIAAGAEVDYRSIESNKLPDAIFAACVKCNGAALKAMLPFSAVCPHQLLEYFMEENRSTIFGFFLMAEVSLGDVFTGLEAKINTFQNNHVEYLWLDFTPYLRETFPSLQGISRKKVRECLKACTTDTRAFILAIENLNVPTLLKNYLRFKV